jgi:hypothetical protein
MVRLILLISFLVTLGGCPHNKVGGGDADAVVIVKSSVGDAALWVDGRYIGPIESLPGGVAVTPGAHRFELRHDDYFSHYEQLELAARERRTLQIELAPVLE